MQLHLQTVYTLILYLFKSLIDLLEQCWFLILKEYPQLSSYVHEDDSQQVDGCGTDGWVSGTKRLLHIVNMWFHVNAATIDYSGIIIVRKYSNSLVGLRRESVCVCV